MLVPLEWVREYGDTSMDATTASEALTMLGLEVEEVDEEGASGSAVLNVTVTSNRGDCLSMIGVARELAADEDKPLKLPSFGMQAEGPDVGELVSVEIVDADLCFRYAAIVIQGITVGPSPEWMQKRLMAAGMRPINNIVDVTNYVMLETGQPLHAFDYDLIEGQTIVVRRARQGETIVTLDGQERKLTPDMLAICDKVKPVAIAGVMGGAKSEVSASTKRILLESACFHGTSVRRTNRALGLPTEASYRFERGVDLGATAHAGSRAAELIRQFAGGIICQGIVDVVTKEPPAKSIRLRVQRVNKILGLGLTEDACTSYLRRLQFTVNLPGDVMEVGIPSYRGDISEEIDLIEEIGRVYGFNNLPETLITGVSLQGKDHPDAVFENRVRRILQSEGLQEVVTHSIVARDTPAAPSAAQIQLRNVLSADVAEMRTSLIPGVVQVLGGNYSRDVRDLCVFEIGRVFRQDDGYVESKRIAGCLMGTRWDGLWTFPSKKLQVDAYVKALIVDFYQVKGVVEGLAASLGAGEMEFSPGGEVFWREGYSADISVKGEIIGTIGEIAPDLRAKYGLKTAAFGFELDFAALMAASGEQQSWAAPSRFPSIKRDLAVVVDEDLEYARVARPIREAASGLCENIELFDVYKGEQLAAGKKSLAFSLTFRSAEKTLMEEEIAGILENVRTRLKDEVGAAFRDS